MNKLAIAISTLLSLIVFGCSQQENPVNGMDSEAHNANGPSFVTSEGGSGNGGSLTAKRFNRLDLIARPPLTLLKKMEHETKLIEPDKKTELKAKFYFKSYGKKDVEFDAKLKIEKGSVANPTVVSLSFDTETGAVVVGPAGVQFLKRAELDVDVKNLDPFADNSTVYFVAKMPDGSFEVRTNQELNATGNNGKIKMRGAEISGSDSFVFGSEVELLSIPAIRRISHNQIGVKVIEPNKDAKLEAKLEYVSTNGNTVSLHAEMKVRKGSVPAGTEITMRIDQQTGRVVFTPHGLQFSEPALLDYKVENINSFVESGIEFVYVNEDGTYEAQIYGSMQVDGSRGRVSMNDAQINHFSQYAFGRRH